MSTEDQARRGSSWEATMRTLAADAVVAEAVLYVSGGRRLTVEHGQPLTEQAVALVQQLVDDVDQAVAAAGYLGGGGVVHRPTSITWSLPRPMYLDGNSRSPLTGSTPVSGLSVRTITSRRLHRPTHTNQ